MEGRESEKANFEYTDALGGSQSILNGPREPEWSVQDEFATWTVREETG